MLVNADILVGKSDIVAHAGAVPDVGYAIDPRPIQKLTRSFRAAEIKWLYKFIIQMFSACGTSVEKVFPIFGVSERQSLLDRLIGDLLNLLFRNFFVPVEQILLFPRPECLLIEIK